MEIESSKECPVSFLLPWVPEDEDLRRPRGGASRYKNLLINPSPPPGARSPYAVQSANDIHQKQ